MILDIACKSPGSPDRVNPPKLRYRAIACPPGIDIKTVMPPKGQSRSQAQRPTGQGQSTEEPLRRSSRRILPVNSQNEEAANGGATGNETVSQEGTDALPTSETVTTRKPAASSPPRDPVQRLASLRGPGRFVEPPPPISSEAQVKKLKIQPKSAIRRNKEEREAIERAEAERLQARLAGSGTSSDAVPSRGDFQGRGAGRGTSGGISNRWQSERYSGAGASGFLGGATAAEDKRQMEALTTRSRGSGRLSTPSGRPSEATETDPAPKVKKEPGSRKARAKDGDGDVVMGDSAGGRRKSTRIKKEQREHTPHDSDGELRELESDRDRVPIEKISLISPEGSSDELLSATEKGKGKETSKTPRPPGSSFMRPVFIQRREHQHRTVGVNTEPTSAISAELQKRAKSTVGAPGSLILPEDAASGETKAKTATKKKTKPSDVEFIKNERKWQGVYQDDEEEHEPAKVKKEPVEAENLMLIDDENPQGIAMSQEMLRRGVSSTTIEDAPPHKPDPPTSSSQDPTALRKPKPRRTKALTKKKPVLQTAEDNQEWHRYKRDLTLIRAELIPKPETQPAEPKIDADGDVEVADVKTQAKDKKEGTVYMFQLPPIMPTIEDPRDRRARRRSQTKRIESEKHGEDPIVTDATTTAATTATSPKVDFSKGTKSDKAEPKSKNGSTNHPKIKPDPDSTAPSSATITATANWALPPLPNPAAFPHGSLGTLTLDADGFPSATWAKSFKLDVGRASDYAAMQEVVLMRSTKVEVPVGDRGRRRGPIGVVKKEGEAEAERTEEGTKCGEEVWAVGQMGGGFVMTPDWGWMFGG